ncbi:hypothetical protein ACTGWZ_11025, partial [Streptococcus suis]
VTTDVDRSRGSERKVAGRRTNVTRHVNGGTVIGEGGARTERNTAIGAVCYCQDLARRHVNVLVQADGGGNAA